MNADKMVRLANLTDDLAGALKKGDSEAFREHLSEARAFSGVFDHDGSTLLHDLCSEFGWNDDLGLLLKEILGTKGTTEPRQVDDGPKPVQRKRRLRLRRGRAKPPEEVSKAAVIIRPNTTQKGLFRPWKGMGTPIDLALREGFAELEGILGYLEEHEPDHLADNHRYLPAILAEHATGSAWMRQMVEKHGALWCSESSDLFYWACHYQNEDLLVAALEYCRDRSGEDAACLRKRLVAESSEKDRPSALGSLLRALGQMDPDGARCCLRVCTEFCPGLDAPGHLLEREESSVWQHLTEQGRVWVAWNRALRFGGANPAAEEEDLDLGALRRRLRRLSVWQEWCESRHVWELLWRGSLLQGNDEGALRWVHEACRAGIQWAHGLSGLVGSFPDALETPDVETGLLPFALAAAATAHSENHSVRRKTDAATVEEELDDDDDSLRRPLRVVRRCARKRLRLVRQPIPGEVALATVYELLRCNPGVL